MPSESRDKFGLFLGLSCKKIGLSNENGRRCRAAASCDCAAKLLRGFDLGDSLGFGLGEFGVQRLVVDALAGGLQVTTHLVEHVFVAGLLEIRTDDVLGVGVGIGTGLAQLGRDPKAEQLVALGLDLEGLLLVKLVLPLEAFSAFGELIAHVGYVRSQ